MSIYMCLEFSSLDSNFKKIIWYVKNLLNSNFSLCQFRLIFAMHFSMIFQKNFEKIVLNFSYSIFFIYIFQFDFYGE